MGWWGYAKRTESLLPWQYFVFLMDVGAVVSSGTSQPYITSKILFSETDFGHETGPEGVRR